MHLVLKLIPGTRSELLMQQCHIDQSLVPVKSEGAFDWPHALVTTRIARAGSVEYHIEYVDTCPCGKPMHPLPFNCDECMTAKWNIGTHGITMKDPD